MSLKLLEIESEEQFKPIGKLLIDGYEKPFNSFWELLKGDGEEELIDRFWQWHQSTPDSHWTIIKDNEDSVIGAAQWIVHEKSPFEQGNPISPPYWWSDGILILKRKPGILLILCRNSEGHHRSSDADLLWSSSRNDEPTALVYARCKSIPPNIALTDL